MQPVLLYSAGTSTTVGLSVCGFQSVSWGVKRMGDSLCFFFFFINTHLHTHTFRRRCLWICTQTEDYKRLLLPKAVILHKIYLQCTSDVWPHLSQICSFGSFLSSLPPSVPPLFLKQASVLMWEVMSFPSSVARTHRCSSPATMQVFH